MNNSGLLKSTHTIIEQSISLVLFYSESVQLSEVTSCNTQCCQACYVSVESVQCHKDAINPITLIILLFKCCMVFALNSESSHLPHIFSYYSSALLQKKKMESSNWAKLKIGLGSYLFFFTPNSLGVLDSSFCLVFGIEGPKK